MAFTCGMDGSDEWFLSLCVVISVVKIVDDSSRRLKQVRDVHRGYGSHLDSGAETLHILNREERNANLFLAFCFLSFFLVALYVSQRRIGNSNTVTFLVKPAFRTATMPFRVLMAIVRSVTGGGRSKRSAMTTPKPSFAPVPGVGSPPSARKPPDEFPSGAVDDIAIPEDENAKAGMEDL